MLKGLFGGKKKRSKSVNDIRKRKRGGAKSPMDSDNAGFEATINARREKNKRITNIRTEMAKAGHFERPDVDGAVAVARSVVGPSAGVEQAAAINRALRLKGSARVIDDTLAHPSLRYLALAIIRGLLEENEKEPGETFRSAPKSHKKPRKTLKKGQ